MTTDWLPRFSDCVLNLYSCSQDSDPSLFPSRALASLCEALNVDKAWWGIMSANGGSFDLHSSARRELPVSFEALWEVTKRDDDLARSVAFLPLHTVNFDEARFCRAPGLATLMGEHDIRHALCTSAHLPESASFMFLSLYRCDGNRHFSTDEMTLKQLLMSHLFSAWKENLRATLKRQSLRPPMAPSSAFVDLQGDLVHYEEEFAARLAREWPNWKPPSLPTALREAVSRHNRGAGARTVIGRLVFRIADAGPLRIINVAAANDLDRLSPREREITARFASGLSHKEIAKTTGLSPATVRHYVRSSYAKLGVSDKGELATLYSSCTGAGAAASWD